MHATYSSLTFPRKFVWSALMVLPSGLCGCGTASKFSDALSDSASDASKAADVATSASSDVLKAHALGLVDSKNFQFERGVCSSSGGTLTVADDLSQFSDALDTVNKVAKKPDDISFAGYVSQIRKNQAAIKAAKKDSNAEKQASLQKRAKNYATCVELFKADIDPQTRLEFNSTFHANNIGPVLGVFLTFRDVATALLQYGEAAQRERAVRETIKSLVPQLQEVVDDLKNTDLSVLDTHVSYPSSAQKAIDLNKSRLGATISIERWMVAQQINSIWNHLKSCRSGTIPSTCISDRDKRDDAADIATLTATYRSLAKIDANDVVDSLNSAIQKASKADTASIADLFDGLFAIGDAVSTISDKVDAVKKARDN